MNLRGILRVFAVIAMVASGAFSTRQPDQDRGAERKYLDKDYGSYGSYYPQWPYPQAADRPSHYPPYHRSTN